MGRRKLPRIVCILMMAASLSGQTSAVQDRLTSELVSREQQIWKAFAGQDLTTLRALFAAGFTFVDADGVIGADALMKDAAVCVERSWTFDHPRATLLGKDAAQLVFHVTQDSACNGKQQATHIYVMTTWIKQNGAWLQTSHTELPAKD